MTGELSGFGPVSLLRPLQGGHRNTVWLAELHGRTVVAKSTRRTEAQIAWLDPVQASARKAGFGVPDMIRAQDGRRVVNGWMLDSFVEGVLLPLKDLPSLASQIAKFHAGASGLTQRPGFCSLLDLVEQDKSGDIDLTALPPQVLPQLRTAWAKQQDAPVQAIHGDLTASNIIVGADGPALLDWDEARVDCLFLDQHGSGTWTDLQSRAHQALEIASGWGLEPDYAQRLWRKFSLSA